MKVPPLIYKMFYGFKIQIEKSFRATIKSLHFDVSKEVLLKNIQHLQANGTREKEIFQQSYWSCSNALWKTYKIAADSLTPLTRG